MQYFVVMIDYGRRGREAVVDPEITRHILFSAMGSHGLTPPLSHGRSGLIPLVSSASKCHSRIGGASQMLPRERTGKGTSGP